MPRPKLTKPNYRLKQRGRIYEIRWTEPDGREGRVSTGQSELVAAEIWRDQWIAAREQGTPPPAQPLISDILDGYLDDRKGEVVAWDRLDYGAKAIKRHVGNLEPYMLRPKTYLERRRADGVGDGTILKEVTELRAALKWATRQQPPWIETAPYIAAPSRPPPRELWWSRNEIDRLVEACDSAHLRLFVLLAYHTAARRGAILDLTWDRVDLEHRRVDYRKPGRRQTAKRRTIVPLNSVILAELQAARTVAARPRSRREAPLDEETLSNYVIEYAGRAIKSVRKAFERACDRAGIPRGSPHVLRHSAASHMVMAGVKIEEVARFLGDTIEMVEKVYAKWAPDYLSNAANALAGDTRPRLLARYRDDPRPPHEAD